MTVLARVPKEERPRERLLYLGENALSLTELLAICLGSGRKGFSVLRLAEELLAKFGGLSPLIEAPVEALTEIKGIGPAKAIQLKAIFALAKRSQTLGGGAKFPIHSAEDAYTFIRPKLEHEKKELAYLLLRDAKGTLFHAEMFGMGTLSEVLIHPRELFHEALKRRAYSVILVHNHPSGDPTPSKTDIELTKLLVSAGRLLGVPLDDHLIIGRHSFTSMHEWGYIKEARYQTKSSQVRSYRLQTFGRQ
ncbi:MAG: DNA repair protein RadC [Chlamydiia bacterium]|nr:DNA repair protein RadC [Chlamydiia bacterium]